MKKLLLFISLTLLLGTINIGSALAQHKHGSAENQAQSSSDIYSTEGKIVDIKESVLTLDHGAIPALSWGPMVMSFKVNDPMLLDDLKVGDKIRFDIITENGSDYIIVDLEKLS